MNAESIITFWFETIEPKTWWKKDAAFDRLLKDQFGSLHKKASLGELESWRTSAHGRLAEIIILDQFSRNIYRNTAHAFAYDDMALRLAEDAVNNNAQSDLQVKQRAFLYMPFMHSESLNNHYKAMKLFSEPGLEGNLDAEKRHMTIIERFNRYPHRNKILGRESTDAEIAFLKEAGSSF